MNADEIGTLLRTAARDLPPADLVGPSLDRARRLRARCTTGAAAGAALLVAGVVAVVSFAANGPSGSPQPAGPSRTPDPSSSPRPTPTGTRTVVLSGLPAGPTPVVDRLGHDHSMRRAGGRTFRLASPETLDPMNTYVDGAAGAVSLHIVGGRYAFGIDGGSTVPVAVRSRGEAYPALRPGPHGSVFADLTPDRLDVVRADGSLATMPTDGHVGITASENYYWGLAPGGKIARLDPKDTRAGWQVVGAGDGVYGVPGADAVWVSGPRCSALHDAGDFRVLWSACGLGGSTPSHTSPDGAYSILERDTGGVDVIGARTWSSLFRLETPRGQRINVGAGVAWVDGALTFAVEQDSGAYRRIAWVTARSRAASAARSTSRAT